METKEIENPKAEEDFRNQIVEIERNKCDHEFFKYQQGTDNRSVCPKCGLVRKEIDCITNVHYYKLQKMETFRKVIIKTEADLPKEEGEYFACRSGFKTVQSFKFTDQFWLKEVRWYLQPIEQECTCGGYPDCICDYSKVKQEQKEVVSVKDFICHKFDERNEKRKGTWKWKDVLDISNQISWTEICNWMEEYHDQFTKHFIEWKKL